MTLQDRFEKFIMADPNSGCWLWTGSVLPPPALPYGRFQLSKRKSAQAHRVSFELYRGQIPPGLCVLHKCDVACCVNPSHFFLGTKADNNADKERKGRGNHAISYRNSNTKLTEAQVLEIKQKLLNGSSTRQLAREYPVHRSSIMDLKAGRSWAHLQLS